LDIGKDDMNVPRCFKYRDRFVGVTSFYNPAASTISTAFTRCRNSSSTISTRGRSVECSIRNSSSGNQETRSILVPFG
jgi:hypothetical protein